MTREEATSYWKQRSEHIHNWLEENEDVDFIGEYVEAIDMAIEALQAKTEWIPASKRLPDTDVPVLVSDGVYVWEDELQEDYEDGKTIYWWDSQCSFDFNDTAWMPKPKPFKKDCE